MLCDFKYMLGGWVNPHREQQTIPQCQTSLPPKYFSTPTVNGQIAPRTGSARGVGRRGGPHTEHGLGVLLSLYKGASVLTRVNPNPPIYPPTYLPAYLHAYLPTHLPIYLPAYLPTCLSFYRPAYLSNHPPIYLPTYLPVYLPAYLPTHLPSYLPTCLSTYLPIFLSACLLI